MEVSRRGFPEIITDNDEVFLQHLCGVIEATDELSCMEISRTPHSYHFRIAPSIPMYVEPLIHAIVRLNNMFNIRLDMSKSMKASGTVTFDIHINN